VAQEVGALLARGHHLLAALQRPAAQGEARGVAVTTLRFVLGDQLTRGVSSLRDLDLARDVVCLVEVHEEATYVPHHPQKIALFFSAMRHFAEALRAEGATVDYLRLDDPHNPGGFTAALAAAVRRHGASRVVVTEPSEFRVREMAEGWTSAAGVPVEVRDDDRFFCSHARFRRWAQGRKGLRMEFFYREMRRETGLLMEGDEPAGGQWNFDHDNRKRMPATLPVPHPPRFAPDAITREVLDLVAARYGHHFGALEPFAWPVTRADALRALDDFVTARLARFGDYQDAMRDDAPFGFHSLLAAAMNLGLLLPREVCDRAVDAWRQGLAPLNAVEGFVRQILGWREYVRGVYWLNMPGYAQSNALSARRPLPAAYWGAPTPMRCVARCVDDTRRNAYAHHIQRLMVTGNLALLAGVAPDEVERWYLAVYADALDWVELPNTHGMALYADGGVMASKPYAASGAYIARMSDYCAGCAFDPDEKLGPRACPFNVLYWAFLMENETALAGNPRMAMPYKNLARFDPARRAAIAAQADEIRATLLAP
jgi:deoxyribodipyrimidine photolyase-related protein